MTPLPPRPPQVRQVRPGLRIVLANNPSPMTYWGTNSYIIGSGDVAVIDPGPADPTHLDAILSALASNERVSHIFVTHAHRDHSPGARLLSEKTGAPVYAFGDASAGRSPLMEELARQGTIAGGEGVDADFQPDLCLEDGARISHGDWCVEALWTPGHIGNHMAFAEQESGALYCGDLVMGWATSLVSPPDGDLSAFMASLARLLERGDTVFYPGHGDPIDDPQGRLRELRAHRELRTTQIRDALRSAPASARTLAERIYTDTPPALLPAATRNVLAHLIDMKCRNEADTVGSLTEISQFHLLEE